MQPARPCPTWSNAATFAGIAETIAVHTSAAVAASIPRTCGPAVMSAWSWFTRQALPAFFGPLELIQYLRGDLPMPLLIGMHVERVPAAVVQIDREREHVGRQGFTA